MQCPPVLKDVDSLRSLVCFAIGFVSACAASAYLLPVAALFPLAVLLGAAALLCIIVRKRGKLYFGLMLLFTGCALGLGWFSAHDFFYVSTAREYDGKTVSASVEISDYSYDTNYGVAGDGILRLEGRTYRVKCYLPQQVSLSPGDAVCGEFQLRFTGNGGSQTPTYHQGEGIFLLTYADEDANVIFSDEARIQDFPAKLRKHITVLLSQLFPEDTKGFALALLLGDTSELSYEDDTALKVSGIRHVAAVSGLHVSILFSFLYRFCGKRRALTAVVGLPVLFVFAAVAGFSASVVRSCIMQSLMILAMLFNREYDSPTSLGFAALVMLLLNPLTITSVSFQLSAGCMVGILLFSEKISDYLLDEKRLGKFKKGSPFSACARWISGSISVSISAMIITVPLSAFYFHMVSLIGIVTNLLTLWVISFVFYGIMASCVVGAILLPAGHLVAVIVSWAMRFILSTSAFVAEIPFAAVYTQSIYIVLWLILCYVLIALFLLLKRKHVWLLLGCMASGLVISLALSWVEPQLDNYRINVLNVGQGQCIVIQCGGKNFMIDCGGDTEVMAADTAVQFLLSQGVGQLDGIFLTHFDKDHAGGITPLLTRVEAEKLYLPDISPNSTMRSEIAASAEDKTVLISRKTEFDFGECLVTIFPGYSSEDDNECGMFILFQIENCDILITGDQSSQGERLLVAQHELPDLELLVVGHHGSDDATSFELLDATHPKNTAISVGADNAYGHPHVNVLKRLYLFSCDVKRTDTEGTIIYRG